jgi:DNA-binding transcriptional LysR family regulator
MDRLENMGVFVAVAEEGGFAAAGRRLSLSPPSVTRAVAALEAHLGVTLLHRTTRAVRLTDAGQRYLGDCKRILADIAEADVLAVGAHAELGGRIALTAPVMLGRALVAPVLFDFLAKHPKVGVRALFVDRVVDLLDEGIDVAIRIAELPESAATAVRVGSVRRVVCAAPSYLKERGVPHRPTELGRHDAIGFFGSSNTAGWSFSKHGRAASPAFPLVVNSADVAVQAALAGRGLLRALTYQVERELRSGKLRTVLTAYEPRPLPVHLVLPEGRRASARVRAFVDFAVEKLRTALRDVA